MSTMPKALEWRKISLNVFASIPRAWIKNMYSGAEIIKTTGRADILKYAIGAGLTSSIFHRILRTGKKLDGGAAVTTPLTL